MSRDKQIEKMAKLCTDKCRDCHNNECIETTKSQHCIAETLYNAGYRKASEVAEEIFAEIEVTRKKCFDECFKWYGNTDERRELLNYDANLQIALAALKRRVEGKE